MPPGARQLPWPWPYISFPSPRFTATTCTPWEPACLAGWSVASSEAQPWPGRGSLCVTSWGAAWGTPEPGLCRCPWAAAWPAFCSVASSLLGRGYSSVRSPSSLVSPDVGLIPSSGLPSRRPQDTHPWHPPPRRLPKQGVSQVIATLPLPPVCLSLVRPPGLMLSQYTLAAKH